MSVKTKLTALITASALVLGTLSVTASPAAALGQKDRQALTVILGVGAAALLLDQASRNRDHRVERPRVVARPHDGNRYTPPNRWNDRDRHGRYDNRGRYSQIAIPARCTRMIQTRHGWQEVVKTECLDRHGRYVGRR
ncbi:hypothetical protein FGG78_04080 [Thioclava sp. BHET1]|uniref:Surface antigen domain-containing protein n=1 Tax=Thioclava dalianensis TaxID=1185766 RepID=A0A074TA69_9RHOB|nr:hypothetical protein [Thioclava dalianensis]KEP68696.1 hypothetical protein DL1_09340 [Thioclava dalianensis]TMV94220.1 hypothetical protein FGG78_04080 [Thioclava sp. BHET1]SFM95009.1 hypothetical protein SAMN05216224_1011085 [Thioclava dalianensis]